MLSIQDFLGNLFPYKSLFSTDGQTLTAWWIVLSLLIFLFYSIKLFKTTHKLKIKLTKYLTSPDEFPLAKDTHLSAIWADYEATFISFKGVQKTDAYASEYFNEPNLLKTGINLKLISAIPSILVGIGILGTFVGLTYGISNFNTSSTEEIKNSIELLLSGMGTAFITSIYGMLLSVLFTFFEKLETHKLDNLIHALCYRLDNLFKLTNDDLHTIEQNRSRDLLNEYFATTNSQGAIVKPINLLRDIYSESTKQSVALQSFSTDLANLIEEGFNRILNDPNKGVVFELQNLKQEIISLGTKLKDPASEMTKNIADELKAAMTHLMDDFKSSVSGTTKNELEQLSTILNQAGHSLLSLPGQVEQMTVNLHKSFNSLQETINNISKETGEQSRTVNEAYKEQIESFADALKDKIGDLQIGQEMLLSKQGETMTSSSRLIESLNEHIVNIKSLTTEINTSLDSFKSIHSDINATAYTLRQASDSTKAHAQSLQEAQAILTHAINDFASNNKETLSSIQVSLMKAQELHREYSENFEIIQNGLSEIFQQIDIGLNKYRSTIGESLQSYLGQYTEALTDTAKSLSNAASKQEEILEELTEQLSNLKSR